MTCAKGYEQSHPTSIIPHYKYIAVLDHEACDLSPHFEDAVDFIKDKLAKTNVNHIRFRSSYTVLRVSVDQSAWLSHI